MRTIEELKGTEKGACIILGSGRSSLKMPDEVLNNNIKKIAVNFSYKFYNDVDYVIYTDKSFIMNYNPADLPKRTVLIGLQSAFDKYLTDYIFNWESIIQGFHTGFYACQIAEILGFNKIYLAGFDYYIEGSDIYSFQSDICEKKKNMYKRVLNKGYWIQDFDRVNWKSNIFNCNPESKLKKFPYQIPKIGG